MIGVQSFKEQIKSHSLHNGRVFGEQCTKIEMIPPILSTCLILLSYINQGHCTSQVFSWTIPDLKLSGEASGMLSSTGGQLRISPLSNLSVSVQKALDSMDPKPHIVSVDCPVIMRGVVNHRLTIELASVKMVTLQELDTGSTTINVILCQGTTYMDLVSKLDIPIVLKDVPDMKQPIADKHYVKDPRQVIPIEYKLLSVDEQMAQAKSSLELVMNIQIKSMVCNAKNYNTQQKIDPRVVRVLTSDGLEHVLLCSPKHDYKDLVIEDERVIYEDTGRIDPIRFMSLDDEPKKDPNPVIVYDPATERPVIYTLNNQLMAGGVVNRSLDPIHSTQFKYSSSTRSAREEPFTIVCDLETAAIHVDDSQCVWLQDDTVDVVDHQNNKTRQKLCPCRHHLPVKHLFQTVKIEKDCHVYLARTWLYYPEYLDELSTAGEEDYAGFTTVITRQIHYKVECTRRVTMPPVTVPPVISVPMTMPPVKNNPARPQLVFNVPSIRDREEDSADTSLDSTINGQEKSNDQENDFIKGDHESTKEITNDRGKDSNDLRDGDNETRMSSVRPVIAKPSVVDQRQATSTVSTLHQPEGHGSTTITRTPHHQTSTQTKTYVKRTVIIGGIVVVTGLTGYITYHVLNTVRKTESELDDLVSV